MFPLKVLLGRTVNAAQDTLVLIRCRQFKEGVLYPEAEGIDHEAGDAVAVIGLFAAESDGSDSYLADVARHKDIRGGSPFLGESEYGGDAGFALLPSLSWVCGSPLLTSSRP